MYVWAWDMPAKARAVSLVKAHRIVVPTVRPMASVKVHWDATK